MKLQIPTAEDLAKYNTVPGAQIERICNQYGVTQTHLGDILGVSGASVGNWMRGDCVGPAARLTSVLFSGEHVYAKMRLYLLEQKIQHLKKKQLAIDPEVLHDRFWT